jgi:hypothetical protein
MRHAQALLSAPDITTVKGLRDRAILPFFSVAVFGDLRTSLTFTHIQRDGRWCIVDLLGKHGRVRTAPMPTWYRLRSMHGRPEPVWWMVIFSGR